MVLLRVKGAADAAHTVTDRGTATGGGAADEAKTATGRGAADETVQGTALAAFEGATYGANCLDLKKGDRILVFPKSTTEGWVLAKNCRNWLDSVELL